MTHRIKSVDKFDEIVENELNKGIETAKPEVGDVSEDKGKDANVAEAADEVGENGTVSDLLCSYWLCRRGTGILKLWGEVSGDLIDVMGKSIALGICGVGEYLNDTPVQRHYKASDLTI
ncbi:hypothetical protein F8M41_014627 [Gigaspora margarita]|uniref:Uncharacterized protein n=1 Tax=Gigaspora margarita TaxID=4874 RepID=A0A8H4B3G6_GIGMA|nr:hypothetical protein F8M41_014627 [Gigaspora margarita]